MKGEGDWGMLAWGEKKMNYTPIVLIYVYFPDQRDKEKARTWQLKLQVQ